MKFLPWQEHFSRVFVLIGLFASAASCDNDTDHKLSDSTTQFAESQLTFAENDGEQTIDISFDNPAPFDGEIVVTSTALVPSCYSTDPASELGQVKIRVFKGDTKRSFKMTPTDNSNLDGEKVVKFTITSVSEGLIAGASKELHVSVTDDEGPAVATFDVLDLKIRENTDGAAELIINFSRTVAADGVLVVRLQSSSTYGVQYATQPEAVSNKIFLPVTKGATSATVSIYPVNDQIFRADRIIQFTISDATGGVEKPEAASMLCTITDDDGQQLTNISAIRAMYEDQSIMFSEDTYIEGIVTSIDNTLGGRVVIEDATGALPIQLLSDEVPTRGDIILVNIKQGTLHKLQGTLEVSQVATYEKLGEDDILIQKVSLTDLLGSTRRLESRTVQMIGLTFTQADGSATLRGDRILTDGQNTIILRTGDNADFADTVIPSGPVVITGIFVDCDGLNVIYPQESKDVKKQGIVTIRPHKELPAL